MTSYPKIGIVGLGYVGNAIKESLSHLGPQIVILDPPKGIVSTYENLATCAAVFICVPTPQGDDGSCDTSILESVLENLAIENYTGVVISKCTAPPDTYKHLNDKFHNLVHAPEFLTAANAVDDYINGKFLIIGGKVCAYQHEAERIIKLTQPNLKNVKFCSISEAALAKYAINSFLATKVVFMNELWNVAVASGLDFDTIASMIKLDERIGNSHMKVPGPDGSFGFGGYCFPKDTAALLKYAESVNKPLNVLDAAVKKNTLLRLHG
jgi:UDPglucose 6-dehydrogenase